MKRYKYTHYAPCMLFTTRKAYKRLSFGDIVELTDIEYNDSGLDSSKFELIKRENIVSDEVADIIAAKPTRRKK